MREGWAAVVLQRAEQRIGIDLVASGGQESATVVAAQVVAVRGDGAGIVEDVFARRACFENRVADLKRRAAGAAVIEYAAAGAARVAT